MQSTSSQTIFTIIINAFLIQSATSECKYSWEGFGIYLGALESFNITTDEIRSSILTHLYEDLKLRNYRTDFLPDFSPSNDEYSITCNDTQTCTWITMHSLFKSLPEKSLYATIWSPPHYMKNWANELKTEYEQSYYYYIKNITLMIEKSFGLSIEKVSIVNEPENFLASWDHCLMSPYQLCRIINSYNDSLTSICAENAWLSTSEAYRSFSLGSANCRQACSIISSHGYTLSLNPFHDFKTVYYDLNKHPEDTKSPVWITEASSTRSSPETDQMAEAIDMSSSIVNFVGTTCVQRWYYWYAFTNSPSGESLIWLNQTGLYFPKKYFAYRHFTRASYDSNDRVDCSTQDYYCLQFIPNQQTVYVNSDSVIKQINQTCNLCCTTGYDDYACTKSDSLPPQSVCSCLINETL